MPRKYRHIGDYEKEIIEMWTNGMTLREIGEKLGYTLQEMKDFKSRYNAKQRKIEAGIALKAKGRPPKDYEVTEDMKIKELKYIIATSLPPCCLQWASAVCWDIAAGNG